MMFNSKTFIINVNANEVKEQYELFRKNLFDIFIKDFGVRFNYKDYNGYKITIASVLKKYNTPIKRYGIKNSLNSRDYFNYTHFYCAGHSYCSPKDKFNKKEGRKIALQRLINNYYFNRIFPLDKLEVGFNFLKENLFYLYCLLDYIDSENILPSKLHVAEIKNNGLPFMDLMNYRLDFIENKVATKV